MNINRKMAVEVFDGDVKAFYLSFILRDVCVLTLWHTSGASYCVVLIINPRSEDTYQAHAFWFVLTRHLA